MKTETALVTSIRAPSTARSLRLLTGSRARPRVSAVICARNEEGHLSEVLSALKHQSLPLHEIILVNDGSTDNTPTVARKLGANVVDLPYHQNSVAGTPGLAERFNIGLDRLTVIPDYVLIVGADDVLPRHYVETIVERMEGNPRLVVASGQIVGEPTVETAPRGGGRLVKTWFWRQTSGLRFPPLWCWEEWMIYKALQLDYEVHGFPDVLFVRQRRQGRTIRKVLGDGKSMYALGYQWDYALVRFAREMFRSPKMAIFTLCGWLLAYRTNVKKADIAEWVNRNPLPTLPRAARSLMGKIKRKWKGK